MSHSSDSESNYASCEEDEIDTADINPAYIEETSIKSLLGKNIIEKYNYNNYYIKKKKKIIKFVENIGLFTNNNPLSRKHIENIKENLKKEAKLVGIFTTVQFTDDCIMLIDGHHRITAIRELLKEGSDICFPLDIHNYKCMNATSDDTIKLFEQVNSTKPFKTDIEITKTCVHTIQTIDDRFPKLFSLAEKRANFPKLHKKTFNDKLYFKMKDIKLYDDELILKILLNFNDKYVEMSKEHFITFMHKTKNTKNIARIESKYEKFKREKCFLGCFSEEDIIDELSKFKLDNH